MYLLVFVTLLIGITGLYAQIMGLQASRINARQTTVAHAMAQWQGTSSDLAQHAVTTANFGVAGGMGCSLTTSLAPPGAGPAACVSAPWGVSPGGVAVKVGDDTARADGMPLCTTTNPNNCWTSLPPQYNQVAYSFNSIAFQAAAPPTGQFYILTYVPPPTTNATNPPPSLITLPQEGAAGASQIGITLSQLLTQIKRSNEVPTLAYGIVTTVGGNNFLTTTGKSSDLPGASAIAYPLPAWVPAGSVGIISAPGVMTCAIGQHFNPVAAECDCDAGALVNNRPSPTPPFCP